MFRLEHQSLNVIPLGSGIENAARLTLLFPCRYLSGRKLDGGEAAPVSEGDSISLGGPKVVHSTEGQSQHCSNPHTYVAVGLQGLLPANPHPPRLDDTQQFSQPPAETLPAASAPEGDLQYAHAAQAAEAGLQPSAIPERLWAEPIAAAFQDTSPQEDGVKPEPAAEDAAEEAQDPQGSSSAGSIDVELPAQGSLPQAPGEAARDALSQSCEQRGPWVMAASSALAGLEVAHRDLGIAPSPAEAAAAEAGADFIAADSAPGRDAGARRVRFDKQPGIIPPASSTDQDTRTPALEPTALVPCLVSRAPAAASRREGAPSLQDDHADAQPVVEVVEGSQAAPAGPSVPARHIWPARGVRGQSTIIDLTEVSTATLCLAPVDSAGSIVWYLASNSPSPRTHRAKGCCCLAQVSLA